MLDVTAAPGTVLSIHASAPARRGTLTTSACGVCGRKSIDDLFARCRPVESGVQFPRAMITALPAGLARAQAAFAATGGLHAAGLATERGDFVAVREDVGRHNAVDKVVGRALLDARLPLAAHVLVVSGRASFEIVQKAVVAGVPLVVAVSAPSTLAVDLAERAGVTLVGFARGEAFNVYSHAGRVGG